MVGVFAFLADFPQYGVFHIRSAKYKGWQLLVSPLPTPAVQYANIKSTVLDRSVISLL
jgi:hypothetical protein